MFKGVKDIYEKLPQISEIKYFDFLNNPKFSSLSYVLKLRNKYDATINIYPSNRREYNLISRIIGADKRLAVKYLRKDFLNFGYLNNVRLLENDNLHNVEENIFLCEYLTGKKSDSIPPLMLNLSNDDIIFADKYFKNNLITNSDLVIGFHPGCSTLKNHEKRRWETDKFAELGEKLIRDHKAKILLFGGGEEEILKEEIFTKINSRNVYPVNAQSISNSAAVMKRCNLFITNDSSLMHIAAALKLNVVAIIGPTNKDYISPWQTNFKIASLNLDCAPCFHYSPKPLSCSRNDLKFKCIKDLPVDLVYEKARDFLIVKK
jgi:heptosyltransferase II